jgi:hypothetical protein
VTVDACAWFEREGVLAEERGLPLDEHLAGCAECRQRQGEIAELRGDLARVVGPGPRDGWQREVWRRIERVPRRRGIVLWVAVPLAAAAVLFLVLGRHRALEPAELQLALHMERDPQRPRTRGDAGVGDTVVIAASGLGAGGELRIYREGLLFRCSGPPACERTQDRLTARWKVPALGRHRVVVLGGPAPLRGSLDEDLAAATELGVPWREGEPVDVW